MAYLREIKKTCGWVGCAREAVVELIDRWNGSRGCYCRKHGSMRLKEQQDNEKGV